MTPRHPFEGISVVRCINAKGYGDSFTEGLVYAVEYVTPIGVCLTDNDKETYHVHLTWAVEDFVPALYHESCKAGIQYANNVQA